VRLDVGLKKGTDMEKPYSIEVVDGIAVVRFCKQLTVSEMIEAFDDFVARGPISLRLWIFESGVNYSTPELRTLAEYGKKVALLPSRNAFVVPDDLSFGLVRMHEVFREQSAYESHVFRDEQEAAAWLKNG
jgi:hypothetical protein